MKAATSLWFDWLSRWQGLTAAEGTAIAAEDWERVAWAQQSKDGLQVEMEACVEAWPQSSEWHQEWQRVIQAERRNSELLERIFQKRQTEFRAVDSSRRNLRSVRRSYAHSQANAGWQSYG